MKTCLIIGSSILAVALVPTISAEDDTTEIDKLRKNRQKKKHNKGSSKASKGSHPNHPHNMETKMCYFTDPTYTQGKALFDLNVLGSNFTYTHANAVNEKYMKVVTQWDKGEITAADVHDRGEASGVQHPQLDNESAGALVCALSVLLITQMKDTCNYNNALEEKYATVATAYMQGFADGQGFDPDFKIQKDCAEAFDDAGLPLPGGTLGLDPSPSTLLLVSLDRTSLTNEDILAIKGLINETVDIYHLGITLTDIKKSVRTAKFWTIFYQYSVPNDSAKTLAEALNLIAERVNSFGGSGSDFCNFRFGLTINQ